MIILFTSGRLVILYAYQYEIIIDFISFHKISFSTIVDSYKCLWAFIGCYTRFSGLQSSLGITNVNRSHNKPLELIETI